MSENRTKMKQKWNENEAKIKRNEKKMNENEKRNETKIKRNEKKMNENEKKMKREMKRKLGLKEENDVIHMLLLLVFLRWSTATTNTDKTQIGCE